MGTSLKIVILIPLYNDWSAWPTLAREPPDDAFEQEAVDERFLPR